MNYQEIIDLLGEEADSLLNHTCQTITKDQIHQPNANHVNQVFGQSDRSKAVKNNLKRLYLSGRLGSTGYLSIFPVDQGVEHTAGYSFAQNPLYFDPENIVKLAVEAECSAVASTLGVLSLVSHRYAAKIPFIVKLNHNELLTYPNEPDQVMFAQVKQAAEMGAAGVGATIYFGSPQSRRQIQEVSAAFYEAHQLGLFTVLWCYPRNKEWQIQGEDYETSSDITGQAIYLGATLGADLVKQKLPTANLQSFEQLKFAKHSPEQYQQLLSDHPIDQVRYQVANAFMGKIGLVNSGGGSSGDEDLMLAIRTAVINKRGGGTGLIMGRKVFNRPFEKGVALVRAVQDVYLEDQVTIA